jgi:Core-2/I-Branching enzyme
VVYLILSHRAPDQLLRLVRTLRRGSPQAQIVVSHDYCASHLDPAIFHGISNFTLLPSRTPVAWGSWSQLARYMHALEWAEANLSFGWIVPLSGQDYPIRPLAEIEEELERTTSDVLIDKPLHIQRDVPSSYGPALEQDYRMWFFYRHYRLPSWGLPRVVRRLSVRSPGRMPLWYLRHMAADGPIYVGLRSRTPFDAGLRCLKGSDWFTASSRAVARLVRAWREDADLVKHYRRTLSPVESFFHTVLLNAQDLPASLDNRRYIVWARDAAHPKLLRSEDLDDMLASGQHFARKFDLDVDSTVLDELDRRLDQR